MRKLAVVNKKKFTVFVLIAASLLIFLALGATKGISAYFTSTADVTNSMLIGDVDSTIDEEFHPTKLEPGKEVTKEVKVTNNGQNTAFIRARADFSSSQMEKLVTIDYDTENWTLNTSDGFWYYNASVAPGESTTELLKKITVSSDVTQDQIHSFDLLIRTESKVASTTHDNNHAYWQ